MKYQVSSTPDGLKFASCFAGCEVKYPYNSVAHLTGIYRGKYLLSEYKDFEDDVDTYWLRTTITLDLSTLQPCIYACMREGLKVEVELLSGFSEIINLSLLESKQYILALYESMEIKSIRILGLEDMDGVEVIE